MRQLSSDRVARLSAFLRRRRASVRPDAAGVVVEPGRRVRGLRREEVAERAGISTTWYGLFERGARTDVSPQTVLALARVLELGRHEVAYLFLLLDMAPPPSLAYAPLDEAEAAAIRTIAAARGGVGMVAYDVMGRIDAIDPAGAAILGFPSIDAALGVANYRRIFVDPRVRERYASWERYADYAVAAAHVLAAKHGTAPPFLDELLREPEFARRWTHDDVHTLIGGLPTQQVRLDDSGVVDVTGFGVERPDGGRIIYYYGADDDARERLTAFVPR